MTAPDLFGGVSAVELPAEEKLVAGPVVGLEPDQVPLFDLTELTVKVPGQEQREAMDAAGVTPASRRRTYEEAVIRQIVTYWQQDDYVIVLEKLRRAAELFGTDNHTDTVEKLLDWVLAHHDASIQLPARASA